NGGEISTAVTDLQCDRWTEGQGVAILQTLKAARLLGKTMDDPAKEVSIDEFKKLEIRVGLVVEVSRVPRTEKLYKGVVDFGPQGRRQTVTGLVGYYAAEELMNKRDVYLVMLKHA